MVRRPLCPYRYGTSMAVLCSFRSRWSSDDQVLTKRPGPYSPAVLRFNISFPAQYPDVSPLVTFATDIFHPLLVPLTTYTFSTSAGDANETVSASDEERLPPGGFSLRDGFPQWFGRWGREARGVVDSNEYRRVNESRSGAGSRDVSVEPSSTALRGSNASPALPPRATDTRPITIVDVLAYIKSTFEDPSMLDKVSLEAAGNPGAWHAWRSHRGLSKTPSRAMSPANGERSNAPGGGSQALPGDWNWERVWENRVRNGIENSLSDPVLFGLKSGRGGDKRKEIVSAVGELRNSLADYDRYIF